MRVKQLFPTVYGNGIHTITLMYNYEFLNPTSRGTRMYSQPSGQRSRSSLLPTLLFALSVTLSACVTINIYFPAAAAEKVADKLIDDIWQLDTPSKKTSE